MENPLTICWCSIRDGVKIEENIWKEMKKNIHQLADMPSGEINDEFSKMISTNKFKQLENALFLLWDLGAFKYIIPYLDTIDYKTKFALVHRLEKLYKDFEFGVVYPKDNSGMNIAIEPFPITKEIVLAILLYDDENAYEDLLAMNYSKELATKVLWFIKTNKVFVNSTKSLEAFRELIKQCDNPKTLRYVLSVCPAHIPFTFEMHREELNSFELYGYEKH